MEYSKATSPPPVVKVNVQEGIFWGHEHPNQICISHHDDNGEVKTYWCDPTEVPRRQDPNGLFRSSHALLYCAVTGEWPSEESFEEWFGWSQCGTLPNFFSCTLNCPHGYKADRQIDGMKKLSLKDMVTEDDFEELMDSYRGRENGRILFAQQYKRARELAKMSLGVDALTRLKAVGKLNVDLDTSLDKAVLEQHCDAFYFAATGQTEALISLIKAKVDVNVVDKNDVSLIYTASLNGHTKTVEALASAGADVNLQRKNGCTALMGAAQYGHTDTVKALAKVGANVNLQCKKANATAIWVAAQKGHTETVEALAAVGADVNLTNINDTTPLWAAAEFGQTKTIEALAKLGGDINHPTKMGNSPLWVASEHGFTETVAMLGFLGADLNQKNNAGVSPIDVAAKKRHKDVVKFLKRRGARYSENIRDLLGADNQMGFHSGLQW